MDHLIGLGGVGHPLLQKRGDLFTQSYLIHMEGGQLGVQILGFGVIVKGHHFHILRDVNFSAFQGGEALMESATLFHEARANFNGISASAGEDTIVTAVFTAEANVSDPVIRLQIGNPSEGAANLGEVTIEIVSIAIYQKSVNETIVTTEGVRKHIPSVSATDTRRPK